MELKIFFIEADILDTVFCIFIKNKLRSCLKFIILLARKARSLTDKDFKELHKLLLNN